MEVVAAVASVAGILSLLGESLDGTKKLRWFFSDMKSAPIIISDCLNDIDSLLTTIHFIREVITRLPLDVKDDPIARLQTQLKEYVTNIPRWLKTLRTHHPASDSGLNSWVWVKKVWVALDINSVKEIRTELCRHKQDLVLNLSILGRTMDAVTAVQIKELDSKVSHGTTASLSEIEKQNYILERIETYSEIGMLSSATSVKSLQSIATSLSRIEARAASSEDFSGLRRRSSNADLWKKYRVTRPSNENLEYRSRHSSVGSPGLKKSSFVTFPSNSSDRGGALSSHEDHDDIHVSTEPQSGAASRLSARKNQLRSQKSINDLAGLAASHAGLVGERGQAHNRIMEASEPEKSETVNDWEPLTQARDFGHWRDLGLWGKYRLWDTLSEQHPQAVLDYISLARKARIVQNKIDALNLLNCDSNTWPLSSDDSELQQQERIMLEERLENWRYALRAARIHCIMEGHSLYEIDRRLRPPVTNDDLDRFWDQHNKPEGDQASNRYLLHMCGGETGIYGEWSANRGRINHWMFHCLQSDDAQAQIHRSMLAEPPLSDEHWAIQVLEHWYVDGAAVGRSLETAHSAGAVDSREVSQLEKPISDPDFDFFGK